MAALNNDDGERPRAPRRTCVGCRRTDDQDRLVRMVADGAGRVRFDPLRRQPGRGAYVHPDRRCVGNLCRGDALRRAFRRSVAVPTTDENEMWRRIEEARRRSSRNRTQGTRET